MSEQTMVERVAAAVERELGIVEMVLASPQQIKALQAKRIARAAIAAMRVPTEAMLTVGGHMTDEDGKIGQNRARGVWWMMIDAALSEVEA